jgi:cytochrome b561
VSKDHHDTANCTGRLFRTRKSLHWLIVALLITQYIFGWTMPHIGRNTPVTTLISLHLFSVLSFSRSPPCA